KGRPRVSIVSIAHLDDERRMFFVSLLLSEIVGWMRRQSGTSSLRAIVYMDEIAGYFPPVEAPASKAPLLTLLKQARAFGIGIVLATQNTVDLDYKGLGNAGTWFLGRLHTERDKSRVLDGLEGAAAGGIDRAEADKTLSALGKRVFLLHDVHAGAPATFMTRWALSYLRGPLSREQLRALTATATEHTESKGATEYTEHTESKGATEYTEHTESKGATEYTEHAESKGATEDAEPTDAEKTTERRGSTAAPVLPPNVTQYFIPAAGDRPRYRAVALGIAKVTFGDTKLKINETRDVVAAALIGEGAVAVDWTEAEILEIAPADLETGPAEGATFEALPKAAASPKNYATWQKAFNAWLASGQKLDLLRHAALKLTSAAGEAERDFRIRVQNAQREARDKEVHTVRRKFAEKRARLEAALKRAEQGVQREADQASQAKLQTAVSFGATVLGALLGRKTLSTSNLGRATTTMRGAGRAYKESEDVGRAQQNVEDAKKALDDLDAQIAEETAGIAARYDADAANIETVSLLPKRGQILVQVVALAWKTP